MSNKFNVMDVQGRIIVLSENTSIILTLVFALTVLAAIGFFAMTIYTFINSALMSIPFIVGGISSTIYAFIFNHLRKKGDMSVDKAVLPTISGGVVEVTKKTSIWITLAYALVVLGLIAALGLIGYGAYTYISNGIGLNLVFGGVVGAVIALMYIAVLGFLRTKIDFPLNNVIVRDTAGQLIELYKRKSIWLTLGMIISVIVGLLFIVSGILAFTNTGFISTYMNMPMQTPLTYNAQQTYGLNLASIMGMVAGLPILIAGLAMFVSAAVLGFLRVRGHVRPYSSNSLAYPIQQPVMQTYAPSRTIGTNNYQEDFVREEEQYNEDDNSIEENE